MNDHHHTPAREDGPYGFQHSVHTPGVTEENPRAHGAAVWIETCACGARRKVAANQGSREYSAWLEPLRADSRFITSGGG